MTGAELLAWGEFLSRFVPLAVDLAGALRRLVAGEDPASLAEEYAKRTTELVQEISAARMEADLLRSQLAGLSVQIDTTEARDAAEDTLRAMVTEESLGAFIGETRCGPDGVDHPGCGWWHVDDETLARAILRSHVVRVKLEAST